MGRSKRHEKRDHKEGRVIIIEASGLVKIINTANHRVKKTKQTHKHRRLVFA